MPFSFKNGINKLNLILVATIARTISYITRLHYSFRMPIHCADEAKVNLEAMLCIRQFTTAIMKRSVTWREAIRFCFNSNGC